MRPASFLMSLIAILLLYFSTVQAVAVPSDVSHQATAVQPRMRPLGSDYPGPGQPWVNEWKYMNFDMDDHEDVERIQQIHSAFAGMRRICLAAFSSVMSNDAVFARWFPADALEEVQALYEKVVPLDAIGDMGDCVAGITVYNDDFQAGEGGALGCNDELINAYSDSNGNIHFCDGWFDLWDLEHYFCGSPVGDYVSRTMESTALLSLHEILHNYFITPASFDFDIGDELNNDGQPAYGPQRAFALVHGDPPDDDEPAASGEAPELAVRNADNWAWHATNAFFADMHCTNWANNGILNDPPLPYDSLDVM